MSNSIVLGCGYGDEGKGLTVHNLCNPDSLVVRFSGGQQAGHTVIHNGVKHIFSNFGAGTLKGCATFFTEDTCIYPKTIANEWGELTAKGFNPRLYISPFAKVTTPYDVWAGRLKERVVRHGSCGLGIGATMKRNEGPVKLFATDLLAPKILLRAKLDAIKKHYGFGEGSNDCGWTLADQQMLTADLEAFYEAVDNRRFDICRFDQLPAHSNLVFEGSQGILLDMDHGVFPHVTFANTTSKNAWKYTGAGTKVYYVTRCYQTRHGNGPFTEVPITLVNNAEEINVENPWQGPFKIGEIDCGLLRHAISVDRAYHPQIVERNLVVTCVDQRPDFTFAYDFEFEFANGLVGNVYRNDSPSGGRLTTFVRTN
jgi:adenylosuccinate synthase